MLFDVRTVRRDGWCLVAVTGEIDLASVPALRTELERVPVDDVALDLRNVDYLDPVALGVLLAGSLRSTRRGGRFAVVCADGRPRELLVETRLDTILTVVGDADELTSAPRAATGP
jgi:anti-anti-sigma factor